jgi:ATP-dependent Clp protease adaptor protein ClpS
MVKEKSRQTENPTIDANKIKDLVLYNDDIHSFDFVIDSLIDVCNHQLEQAEQCTIIVHYKGKCAVKSGESNKLKPYYKKLASLGLTVTIE